MCGELEEDDRVDELPLQRFAVHARALLERPVPAGEDLHAYLDRLFADLLQRCLADVGAAADAAQPYRRMAMQSVVLARLAGLLAGHVALQEDPLRKVMEALMLGYGEAEAMPARGHHGHDHHPERHEHEHQHGGHRQGQQPDQDHDHGHGYGHGVHQPHGH